ncbi:unnamed protein product [Lactuca saligna]|uniref:Uncharacterized protein n=1 Tax=Lactuca saligna TaxID=75948 RepID=A0AA35YY85_LACSI|nr:unnamed protein product [Lactuca saligna]
MSYEGLLGIQACTGSWSTTSNPTDIPGMIVASDEAPMKGSDDTDPDYTPAEHPSEPNYTPDAGLELLSSDYELDVDEEDIPPRWRYHHPAHLLHIDFSQHTILVLG